MSLLLIFVLLGHSVNSLDEYANTTSPMIHHSMEATIEPAFNVSIDPTASNEESMGLLIVSYEIVIKSSDLMVSHFWNITHEIEQIIIVKLSITQDTSSNDIIIIVDSLSVANDSNEYRITVTIKIPNNQQVNIDTDRVESDLYADIKNEMQRKYGDQVILDYVDIESSNSPNETDHNHDSQSHGIEMDLSIVVWIICGGLSLVSVTCCVSLTVSGCCIFKDQAQCEHCNVHKPQLLIDISTDSNSSISIATPEPRECNTIKSTITSEPLHAIFNVGTVSNPDHLLATTVNELLSGSSCSTPPKSDISQQIELGCTQSASSVMYGTPVNAAIEGDKSGDGPADEDLVIKNQETYL